ncbi:cytochrome c [uncultured Tateyamaria sp.]|uniref:c-type cytochrome n=1 Tax=uncultured Tateyamaria sp. TaxID=455651 RepID=UPI0026242DAB|nr:cytochrome c [uncultured Tateyamaria sp.]
MNKTVTLAIAGFATAAAIGTAIAQQSGNPAVKARTSIMQLYAFNLGALGAMAKGDVEYDAQAASSAANNLVTLTQIDQSRMWPAGSDNSADASSRALPALWQNFPDVMAKGAALSEAAVVMQAAAGQDLDSLRAAMGGVGNACSACHKAYRAPQN